MPLVSPRSSCWRTVVTTGTGGERGLFAAELGDELELAVLDRVAAHDGHGRVAVLGEVEGTERAVLGVVRLDRLDDGQAILLVAALDRVERDLRGDVAVDRV